MSTIESLIESAPRKKRAGQDCTINWDINQNHSTIEDTGTSNGTSGFEEVLGAGGRRKSGRTENTYSRNSPAS